MRVGRGNEPQFLSSHWLRAATLDRLLACGLMVWFWLQNASLGRSHCLCSPAAAEPANRRAAPCPALLGVQGVTLLRKPRNVLSVLEGAGSGLPRAKSGVVAEFGSHFLISVVPAASSPPVSPLPPFVICSQSTCASLRQSTLPALTPDRTNTSIQAPQSTCAIHWRGGEVLVLLPGNPRGEQGFHET